MSVLVILSLSCLILSQFNAQDLSPSSKANPGPSIHPSFLCGGPGLKSNIAQDATHAEQQQSLFAANARSLDPEGISEKNENEFYFSLRDFRGNYELLGLATLAFWWHFQGNQSRLREGRDVRKKLSLICWRILLALKCLFTWFNYPGVVLRALIYTKYELVLPALMSWPCTAAAADRP